MARREENPMEIMAAIKDGIDNNKQKGAARNDGIPACRMKCKCVF
jgi:hypothetical protein